MPGKVHTDTDSRSSTKGHKSVVHIRRRVQPAVWIEGMGIFEDGWVAMKSIGLCGDDVAGRDGIADKLGAGGWNVALEGGGCCAEEAEGFLDDVVQVGELVDVSPVEVFWKVG